MLILSNEEIESFLSIKVCIDALEKAYGCWDKGTAINRPRTDLVLPASNEAGVYAFKSMEAGLYDPPIVAMRVNSDIIRWNQQGNRRFPRPSIQTALSYTRFDTGPFS
jgi:hypothetical protein